MRSIPATLTRLAVVVFALGAGGAGGWMSRPPILSARATLQADASRPDGAKSGEGATESTTTAPAAATTEGAAVEKAESISLERLFPEKGLFGPSASGATMSRSGRYGAFLWRPYPERRHGSDLWIHDFETGETWRVTSVSVMSEFQQETRKVRDDRLEKAKKRRGSAAERGGRGRGERAGEKKEGDTDRDAAAAIDDPLTGTWEGRLESDEQGVLPPEGVPIVMSIRLAADGAVSGTVSGGGVEAILSEGRFDREKNTLTFVARDKQGNTMAHVELTLKEGTLSGTVRHERENSVMRVSLSRSVIGESGAGGTDEGEGAGDDGASGRSDAKGDGDEGGAETATSAGDTAGSSTDESVKATRKGTEGERSAKKRRTAGQGRGDVVDDKDADDEKAPRYAGVSAIVWSPRADDDKLIFTSLGDLYLLDLADDSITRLTQTREDERDVQFLPDGSGYTYLRGEDLLRVRFGAHVIEQLNPRLTGGERMDGYRLSPDGRRLVFIASKGSDRGGRDVNIVNYRDRFAQVRQVRRQMPDDPLPEIEYSIYLYELDGLEHERGQLRKVYSRKRTGPRDVLPVPEWSPDSMRIAFSVYEQASGIVEIREAAFEPKKKKDAKGDGATSTDKGEGAAATNAVDNTGDRGDRGERAGARRRRGAEKESAGGEGDGGAKGADDNAVDEKETEPESSWTITDARPVYRFLHNGGPNTPGLIRPIYLADSRRLVFLTELSGFRHLHILDPRYEFLQQLTTGRFEVYPLEVSEDHRRLFALATLEDPTQQQLFRIDLEDGSMTRLTTLEGVYDSPAVSDDGTRALVRFEDFGLLPELHAVNAATSSWTPVTSSHPEEAHKLTRAKPTYFSYENRHGQTIHGHLFKPADWTPEDKRPLLVYVYGGPLGRRNQLARGSYSSSAYFFAWYMAQVNGYVTCTIDPRGTSGYGALFEKSNYEQVGRPQVEDLVDGVRWLIEHAGVDEKRVGIHGWSFGGFQTQMCLYTEPEVFAVGIAGAGPTEWENYNAWYSTGTIGPNRAGQTDLSKFSLLPLARNLKGRLLLVHGVEDPNVLYQDTVRVYRELLKAGKEALVDLFIDPTGGHGLGGDVKTLNRYRKFEDFLLTHLGRGEPAAKADPAQKSDDDLDAVAGPPLPSSGTAGAEDPDRSTP